MNKKKKIISMVKQSVETELLSGVTELSLRTQEEESRVYLKELEKTVSGCEKCGLWKERANVVFGEGDSSADLMFIGEAPGSEEDKQARPFVGRAGKLLTKIIASIGLERDKVYIANILKCRPPGNRNPSLEEIAECIPELIRQIEIIKPMVICTLGKFASQTILNAETPISRLRGNFHDYRSVKVMPTYHPAYLLRNPSAKKAVWEDVKKIASFLGLEIPTRKRTQKK